MRRGTFRHMDCGDRPHRALPNAIITGGTFTLDTVIHWIPRTVEGTFAIGGTVKRIYEQAGCGIQKYAVADGL